MAITKVQDKKEMSTLEASWVLKIGQMSVREKCREGKLEARQDSRNRWVISGDSVRALVKKRGVLAASGRKDRRKCLVYLTAAERTAFAAWFVEKYSQASFANVGFRFYNKSKETKLY